MSVWQHADLLPPVDRSMRVSLGEANTPLVRSRRIGPSANLGNLYFKVETTNPTGSYKDRFAAVAISLMLAMQKTRCIATSSGNTGAALAAYCATAEIACDIAIVETAPLGKLQQMLAYGARLSRIRGFGLDPAITQQTCSRLESLGAKVDSALQISAYRYCPLGMQGVQTISYELADWARKTGQSIDHVFAPAGGGGLALAICRGFASAGTTECVSVVAPAVHVVQPEGNDTIATPLRVGAHEARAVDCTSLISGLQVPSVIDGTDVIHECHASGGTGHTVRDEEIWEMQSRLAAEEGVFCEPAGAVAVCGAIKAARSNEIRADDRIVCIVTGSGFKDGASIDRMVHERECPMREWTTL